MKVDSVSNRRKFLLASTLGVAATAVTARTVLDGDGPSRIAAKSEGYRVSPHILKYYNTAKV